MSRRVGPGIGLARALRLVAAWFGLLAPWWVPPAAALTAEEIADDTFWSSVRGCTDAVEVEMYLELYSEGRHVEEARECLIRLGRLLPDPEPVPKKVRSTEIERLLEVCEMHFEANRLTTGVGGTAVECYGEVQARDPGNLSAVEGLQRVFDKYERWARSALEREDVAKARKNVGKLRGLNPEAPEVEELESAIAQIELRRESDEFDEYERLARNALERGDVAEARKNVDKLRGLNPEAPEVEELENAIAQLELRRESDEFDEYERLARDALERGDVAEAREYVSNLRELNPEAPEVEELENAIAQLEKRAERRRADDAAFARAEAEGTPAAYERYVRDFPEGLHVAEAKRRIERLRVRAHGDRFRDCEECPLMVAVRPGTFKMGSVWPKEGPVHEVRIGKPVAMGVYEVTFDEWDACHADGGCSHRPGDAGWGRGSRPVINVSWRDAQQYVQWLSEKTGMRYRLPSEAEWEYVVRAEKPKPTLLGMFGVGEFVWNANCKNCGGPDVGRRTAPVGSFPANTFGVHDMQGNVWERVEDCFNEDYTGAPSDGSAWVSGMCKLRMMRGGAWDDVWDKLRVSNRVGDAIESRTHNVGFRVMRTLTP